VVGNVILVDTNVWLALSLSKHEFHHAARRWLSDQTRAESLLFCRATQQSLLRLLTTEAVTRPYAIPPLTNAAAWELYGDYLADPRIAWVAEPPGVEARWHALAARETSSGKLWMDAYLAAFVIAGGHQLVTTDKAFKQFKDLDVNVLPAPSARAR